MVSVWLRLSRAMGMSQIEREEKMDIPVRLLKGTPLDIHVEPGGETVSR